MFSTCVAYHFNTIQKLLLRGYMADVVTKNVLLRQFKYPLAHILELYNKYLTAEHCSNIENAVSIPSKSYSYNINTSERMPNTIKTVLLSLH